MREGFSLRIGQILDVEVKLEVGAVTESIAVINSRPLLDTQTSSTGQVMEGDYFYELPNYQHWEKGVLYYTPQVESTNAPWPGSLGNWNINGANSYQTAQYEDGMLATSMDGGTTINSVSVGDEEIKVLTSAMPAEYGHATSGALIVVKKGGANEFHGQGGELFKNNPLVERRFFQLQTNPQQGISDLFQHARFRAQRTGLDSSHLQRQEQDVLRDWRIVPRGHLVQREQLFTPPPPPCWPATSARYSNVIYDPASTSGSFRRRQPVAHAIPRQHHSAEPIQHDVERHRGQQSVRRRRRRAPAASRLPAPAETSSHREQEVTSILPIRSASTTASPTS